MEEIGAYLHAYGASRWELALARNATLEAIDTEAVERYLGYRAEKSRRRRRHSSLSQLLLGLEAVAPDGDTGEVRPTNAAVLMFGYDPQLYLPQSEVVCIKYADPLGVRRYIERKNYHGTLPELVDQTSAFLRQFIRVGATIRGFYRQDEPEYPYEAIREAVVNAIVHRDYSRSGETIRVFMFPDRVEVRSPGGLLPGITLEDLVAMRVTSNPRNQILAGFLRDIPGYMERVGSGVRFMINEMREMGLPDPEFSEHFDFMVVFRNGVVAEETSDLNPRQQTGLQLVREKGSISTSEYVVVTGAPARTAYRDLQNLVERGLLVVRGKRRGARYYLV
ncbi:MAG: hypothetical protein EOM24_24535 [Chloroflexia bacterium]|nr:hypothetical protein [Chloroflexia bacterium]